MKRPALAKGSPKKPLKKRTLKRHNLKKLGEMNLKERCKRPLKNMRMKEMQQQSFRSSSPLQRRAGLGAGTKPTFAKRDMKRKRKPLKKGTRKRRAT